MTKPIIVLSLILAFFMTACGPASEKGKWNDGDKQAFDEVWATTIVPSLTGTFSDAEQATLKTCIFDKIQTNYDSYSSANSDEAGVQKISEDCAKEIVQKQLENVLQGLGDSLDVKMNIETPEVK